MFGSVGSIAIIVLPPCSVLVTVCSLVEVSLLLASALARKR